jgi:hypothetical protein
MITLHLDENEFLILQRSVAFLDFTLSLCDGLKEPEKQINELSHKLCDISNQKRAIIPPVNDADMEKIIQEYEQQFSRKQKGSSKSRRGREANE